MFIGQHMCRELVSHVIMNLISSQSRNEDRVSGWTLEKRVRMYSSPSATPALPIHLATEASAIYRVPLKMLSNMDLRQQFIIIIIIIIAIIQFSSDAQCDFSEYLGPRGMRMGSVVGSTMTNFIFCTVDLI